MALEEYLDIETNKLYGYLSVEHGVENDFTKTTTKNITEKQNIQLKIKEPDVIKWDAGIVTGSGVSNIISSNETGEISFDVLKDASKDITLHMRREMDNYGLMMFLVDVSGSMNNINDYYRIQADVIQELKHAFAGTGGYKKVKYILAKIFFFCSAFNDCSSTTESDAKYNSMKSYFDLSENPQSSVTVFWDSSTSTKNQLIMPWIKITYSDSTTPDVFHPANYFSFPSVDDKAKIIDENVQIKDTTTFDLPNSTLVWSQPDKNENARISIYRTSAHGNFIIKFEWGGQITITAKNGKTIKKIDYFSQNAGKIRIKDSFGKELARTYYSIGQIAPTYLTKIVRFSYDQDMLSDDYPFIHDVPFMNSTTIDSNENVLNSINAIEKFNDVDSLYNVENYESTLNGISVNKSIVILSDELYTSNTSDEKTWATQIKSEYGNNPSITMDGNKWDIKLPKITGIDLRYVCIHKRIKNSNDSYNYKPMITTKVEKNADDQWVYTFPFVEKNSKTFNTLPGKWSSQASDFRGDGYISGQTVTWSNSQGNILHFYYE